MFAADMLYMTHPRSYRASLPCVHKLRGTCYLQGHRRAISDQCASERLSA